MVVTPGNQGLIFHLLRYLGDASIIADPRLIDLTTTLMSMLQHDVELSSGFRDTAQFKSRFYSGIERILENKYLPVKYHSQIW